MAHCPRPKVCRRIAIRIGDRHFTTQTATPVAWPRILSISQWDPVARKLWHRLDLYRSNESVVVRLNRSPSGIECLDGLFVSRSFAISETKKTTAKQTAAGRLSRHDANRCTGLSETRFARDNSRVRRAPGARSRRKHRRRKPL